MISDENSKFLDRFKEECKSKSSDEIVQRHLIDGSSYFFNELYTTDDEFHFKKSIADSLGVHIRDIVLVGSGKLGFSIKPEKADLRLYLFKKFDYEFSINDNNKKSDLDVAIVSGRLFDDQLIKLYQHTDCYLDSVISSGARNQIAKYILKGWIQPNTLPKDYKISQNIEDTQSLLSQKYKREVNIGIYKSWFYFEKYHQRNIHTLSLNLLAHSE
ncbi:MULTISPECIES: hypothetical protein [Marinobacter]|jgi:hypothetical protein|uniref:hypothetical protein n=1 Tax=Marinobacter TaxID=2742 RepID=UPI0009490F9D|nr:MULTISPECIES: hypothetical protein [Marinobacter]OLF85751.1 hypothetical protein AWH63_01940 [Marinobacter sp. C18]|tara:strand:+ start:1099 stop:1743 length:645 start_codon:yes stop_codon:yes gene_type:complete